MVAAARCNVRFLSNGVGHRPKSHALSHTGQVVARRLQTRWPKRFHQWTETRMSNLQTRKPGRLVRAAFLNCLVLASGLAFGHGDVTPQAVDTKELPTLGDQWRAENPYRKNDKAIMVGTSAYNQNCARCHGLEAISGGIAPDLRKLDNDCAPIKDDKKKSACVKEMDEYYAGSVRRGKVRNGAVYMPPFEGILNQEATWAIKAYLETRREKPL
jgi:cytochrome c-550 PedF